MKIDKEAKELLKDFISCLPGCIDCFGPATYLNLPPHNNIYDVNYCDQCLPPQYVKKDHEKLYSKSLREILKLIKYK